MSLVSKHVAAKTRTGGFPIGLRRGGFEWHQDLKSFLAWAGEHGIGTIDLNLDADQTGVIAVKNGFRLGSVDLPDWKRMISPDKAVRDDAVAKNSAYIKACAAFGPMNHFLVMLPEKPELPRAENFGYMLESYRQLVPVLEAHQATMVIEGWPGPGALCCTPENYRAFFKECPSKAMGVNYDPSHLVRMGIDQIRFLREFIGRVHHVHAKDTELIDEGLYQYGNYQEPTFRKPSRWGAAHWRYAIPGHGSVRWTEIFAILAEAGYKGAVSIELEDDDFYGTPEREKAGVLHALNFLQGC
ncbi:MAG: sugar phosphate isomerase/epimerase [Methylacidiphilales bacterium]|nr:sugar phosphate isomerase/epimerase [Candidatus Methylacidiphilales bacterium]